MYNGPARGETMTVEDTIAKTALNLALVVVAGAASWMLLAPRPEAAVPVMLVSGIVGLVLAMVNIFRREPSPALIMGYSVAQGVALGAISMFFEMQWPGIVLQAILATFAVFGVTLALFASGKVRASAKATKVFMIAIVGYLVYSIINVFVMLFGGAGGNPWGLDGLRVFGLPLGLILGVLVVIMAAYSLVLDFDSIQRGVKNGAPKKFGWTAAFGIMVTMIWLYTQILRMLAIARSQ